MANTKGWSYKAGEKGRNRVRVYEDRKSGNIMLEWWESEEGGAQGRRRTRSLGHSDRQLAKRKADEVAAKFASLEWDGRSPITLQRLFEMYLREVTPTKAKTTQKHDRRSAEMFQRFLGASREARTLSILDWNRFIQDRRAGRVRPAKKTKATRVGNRQIEQDLKWLLAVLNWATMANRADGKPFLDRNPCKGFPLPREENPRRPMMTRERLDAMLKVASQIDWRFELALILARETEHRIGAIRKLRWSDVDFEGQRIRWRGEVDKIGFEHVVPVTECALQALREAQKCQATIGDAWVFPAPGDSSVPCSRHIMRDWWKRSETLAKLDSVAGLGWHSIRRLFATELKDIPLKDLCNLGGWKDFQTVLKCYQRPDEETMRSALEQRRKLG